MHGAEIAWRPAKPRFRPLHLGVVWAIAAVSVYVGAGLVAGVRLPSPAGAFIVAAAIGVVNAVLPPTIAAMRLPFTLVLGFVLVLVVDAFALVVADDVFPSYIAVDSFGSALLASLVIAAATIVPQVLTGTNDDGAHPLGVVQRVV